MAITITMGAPWSFPSNTLLGGNCIGSVLWWNGMFAYGFEDAILPESGTAVVDMFDTSGNFTTMNVATPIAGCVWNSSATIGNDIYSFGGPFIESDKGISYIEGDYNTVSGNTTLTIVRDGAQTYTGAFGVTGTEYTPGAQAQASPNYYHVLNNTNTQAWQIVDDGTTVAMSSVSGVYLWAISTGANAIIFYPFSFMGSPTYGPLSNPIAAGQGIAFSDGATATSFFSYFGEWATFGASDGSVRAVNFTMMEGHVVTSNKTYIYVISPTLALVSNGNEGYYQGEALPGPTSAVYPSSLLIPLPAGCIPLC